MKHELLPEQWEDTLLSIQSKDSKANNYFCSLIERWLSGGISNSKFIIVFEGGWNFLHSHVFVVCEEFITIIGLDSGGISTWKKHSDAQVSVWLRLEKEEKRRIWVSLSRYEQYFFF